MTVLSVAPPRASPRGPFACIPPLPGADAAEAFDGDAFEVGAEGFLGGAFLGRRGFGLGGLGAVVEVAGEGLWAFEGGEDEGGPRVFRLCLGIEASDDHVAEGAFRHGGHRLRPDLA
jgi:hypothetical protein